MPEHSMRDGAGDPDQPVSSLAGLHSGASVGSGVAGQVIDATGAPVAGAVVMPRSYDSPPQEIPEIAVITSPDGRYQWSLPPGRYSFTVHHDRYAPHTTQPISVAPGHISSFDITLPSPGR